MTETRQALKDISQILHNAGWDADPALPHGTVNFDELKNFQVVVRMSDPPQVEIVDDQETPHPAKGRVISNNLETTRKLLSWLQGKIGDRSTSLTK